MINLFFNSGENFEEVASLVFQALGMATYLEGDSQNVLGGYYYSFSVLGMKIQLEQNSYDYEDQYKFMLSIDNDFTVSLNIDSEVKTAFSQIVLKMLKDNLMIEFWVETENGLIAG